MTARSVLAEGHLDDFCAVSELHSKPQVNLVISKRTYISVEKALL